MKILGDHYLSLNWELSMLNEASTGNLQFIRTMNLLLNSPSPSPLSGSSKSDKPHETTFSCQVPNIAGPTGSGVFYSWGGGLFSGDGSAGLYS